MMMSWHGDAFRITGPLCGGIHRSVVVVGWSSRFIGDVRRLNALVTSLKCKLAHHSVCRCFSTSVSKNVNAGKYVRTLSESSIRVSTRQCSGPHGASNCRMVEQQDISTIQRSSQSPYFYMIEQVWDFMGREIVSHACRKKWSDSNFAQFLAEHQVAIFAQSLQPLPRRVGAVSRGAGYPTKYWLTKCFRKKDNIWICLTFPERNILLLQIIEIK